VRQLKKNNFLLEICKEHNTNLSALGRQLNKSKQYMSELNRGNIRLTYEMAEQIANIFNTTPDDLFLSQESNKNVLSATGTCG
jgi:transcriptional regulator with XRE-family HTH domain